MQRTHAPVCGYSEDTEILTRGGWARFGQLTYMDEVATRSPDGRFQWQYPEKITVAPYEGEMIAFKNRYIDLLVTPAHPLLVRRQRRHLTRAAASRTAELTWHLAPAKHFAYLADPHWEIPARASWQGSGPSEFFLPNIEGSRRPDLRIPMREFCGLVGLYISEGYIADRIVKGKQSHHIKIEIAQAATNPRLPAVGEALRATGLTWHYRNNRFFTTFARLGRWLKENCGHHAANKKIPAWMKDLPADCLESLLNGLMLGDGTWGPLRQKYYPTTSIRLADDVLELYVKLGMDAAIYLSHVRQVAEGTRRGVMYHVNEILQGDGVHKLPPALRSPHRGNVCNIAVPNKIVLVRRDGRPSWCGTY